MHNDPPLVSIIIPTFNRAHLIGETLDSVLAQTYANWECIIVDDGSTDNTDAVVQAYVEKDARFRYFHRPPEHLPGANGARNFGFKMSRGGFVNWFDDDDVMLEDFLLNKVNAINKQTDIIINFGYFVDDSLNVIRKNKANENQIDNLYKTYALWECEIFICSVLFRKSFLKGKKLFDLKILKGQEAELFSRLFYGCIDKKNFNIINTYDFKYRRHNNTKSSDDVIYSQKKQRGVFYIYSENLKRGLKIKDKEVIDLYYKRLISQAFRAMEYDNIALTKGIKKELTYIFMPKHKSLAYKINIILSLSILMRLNSFKVRNYLKNQDIKL
ncbi:MAG: glycosyltransferase family 2 protein [Flavobacteriaceae bacterium]|nr:glycosyltransferase family 2 protein [Flavobacteriaceae bacterium]